MSVGKNSINRATSARILNQESKSEQKFYDTKEAECVISKIDDVELDFVPIELIIPSYDEASITCKATFWDIVASVKTYGVLIPLLLRKVTVDGETKYRVLSGHKRLFAAKQLNLTKVPAEIITCENRKAAAIYNEVEKYDSKSKSFDKEKPEINIKNENSDLPNYLL